MSYHRGGAMRVDGNCGSALTYEPNSYQTWQEQRAYRDPARAVGDVADHGDYRTDEVD